MPYKDKDTQYKYWREWYHKNKEKRAKIKANVKQRKQEIKKWFVELKKDLSCERCQEDTSFVLDFHHKDPDAKKHEINRMVSVGYSKSAIQREIDKCEVLCVNCHRHIHHLERKKANEGNKQVYDRSNYQDLQDKREKVTKIVAQYLDMETCIWCSEHRNHCLEFHHILPEEKLTELSTMKRGTWKISAVIAEINKCIVLCANCHRKYHYEEKC